MTHPLTGSDHKLDARRSGAAPIRNRIIEGDCTEILQAMPSLSVDLVVTDPPYLVNYRDRRGRAIANDDCPENVLRAFSEVYRVMKPDSYCVSFYGWVAIEHFMIAWKDAGFTPVGHIIWHKDYASRTGHLQARHEAAYLLAKGRPARPAKPLADVQPWEYTGNRRHPTEKAVSVLERHPS